MTTVPFLIILNLNFITNFDLMLHCFRKVKYVLAFWVFSIFPLNLLEPGPYAYVLTSTPVWPLVVQPVCEASLIGFELHFVILLFVLQLFRLCHLYLLL